MADGDEHLGRTVPRMQDSVTSQALAPALGDMQASPAPPRTIVSGVDRLRVLAAQGRDLAEGMKDHVLSMAGSALGMPMKDDGEPGPDVSTNNLHRAIDDIETALGVLGKLIASAKAAHG